MHFMNIQYVQHCMQIVGVCFKMAAIRGQSKTASQFVSMVLPNLGLTGGRKLYEYAYRAGRNFWFTHND